MIALCEDCFPKWKEHEVYSHTPMTPCVQCGKMDNRQLKAWPIVRTHLFPKDPRKND